MDPAWADYRTKFTQQICPFHGEGDYDAAVVQCGYVLVPEDRTDPASRLIRIAVMRIPSTAQAPADGALLFLDGDPGLTSISVGRAGYFSGQRGAPLTGLMDIVFFDQRGSGYSDASFCRAVPEPYQYGVPLAQGTLRYHSRMRQCLAEARQQGVAVDAYSTWQNALDTRDIRRALGYTQWNINAVSYGTELGQAVMQVDPDGVRAAILDSVVPASPRKQGGWGSVADGFHSSLDAVSADCAVDPACTAAYGSLSDAFIRAIKPFRARPLVIDGLPPDAYQGGRLVLDDTLAASIVFRLLYEARLYADLPFMLRALQTRDAAALRAYAAKAGNTIDHAMGTGMRLVTICRGSGTSTSGQLQAMALREPDLARWVDVFDFSNDCAAVYAARPDPAVGLMHSDIPTLVLSGQADPITPPARAQSILSGLANATYLIFPHTGHGVITSHLGTKLDGCGGLVMRNFLHAPRAKVDAGCVARVPAPAFVAGWRETGAAYQQVTALREGSGRILPAAALLGLLFAFFAYPVAALARRLQSHPPAGGARRQRLLSWTGSACALGAVACAGVLLRRWITEHPLGLPMGLPNTIAASGWLAVVALVFAVASLVTGLRAVGRDRVSLGTQVGTWITTALVTITLVWLWRFGAGPFQI